MRHVVFAAGLMCAGLLGVCACGGSGGPPPGPPPPPAGSLDTTFAGIGVATFDLLPSANDVAVQPDGKIVIVGTRFGTGDVYVARLLADGTLDPAFGGGDGVFTDDFLGTSPRAEGVCLLPDGRIAVCGVRTGGTDDFAVWLLMPDGALDPTFDGDGRLGFDGGLSTDRAEACVFSGGHLTVVGYSDVGADEDFAYLVLTPAGVVSESDLVDLSGDDRALDVIAQADGRILLAGRSDGGATAGFYRFTMGVGPDPTLGPGGERVIPGGDARAVAQQPDGNLVYARSSATSDFECVRITLAGALDGSFGIGGVATNDPGGFDITTAIAVRADGTVVLGGTSDIYPPSDMGVYRLLPDGSRDLTFDGDGFALSHVGDADFLLAMALTPDDKIVGVGGQMGSAIVVRWNN